MNDCWRECFESRAGRRCTAGRSHRIATRNPAPFRPRRPNPERGKSSNRQLRPTPRRRPTCAPAAPSSPRNAHQLEVLSGTKKQRAADLEGANATLAAAKLKLGYTKIVAPFDGVTGERLVQPGDYVNIGSNLINVVPLPNVYVMANYKETQDTPHQRINAFAKPNGAGAPAMDVGAVKAPASLVRGGHYGQRSCEPHLQAEHVAAPTNAANVKKVVANSEPSTHGRYCCKSRKLHRSAFLVKP
jgi:hypothetical protein